MNDAEVKVALGKVGIFVKTSPPSELAATIKSDLARWKKVVTDANITAD